MLVIQRPTVEAISEEEGNRQRFAVGPLEPGFGHTLGNSLRRTLLSSIPGAAVTQVRFDDALHEFDTITGVTEDVTDIILNLKDLVLTCESDEPVTLRLDVRGPADVTAADIQLTADVEILNRDLHIATLNAKGRLAVDITVERGRGYVSADRNKTTDTIGVIPVDSIFSPVRRVTFQVEPTRVEQSTELRPPRARHRDRRLDHAPRRAGLGRRHAALARRARREDERRAPGPRARRGQPAPPPARPTSTCPIEDLDLSERPRNCLKRAQVNTIGELLEKTEDDLLAITNFGQKSLDEVNAEARRARPVAPRPEEGLSHARHPEEGPPLRRRRRAPAADDGQPGRVAHRGRGHRHHRGQGQGAAPRRREDDHQGQEGRRCTTTARSSSYLGDKEMAAKLFDEIGPRYADRPGGYTRILKLGPRHGDNAPMARIELV